MEEFDAKEEQFIQIARKVGELQCLKPNPDTNAKFSELVSFVVDCGDCVSEALSGRPSVSGHFHELRSICGRAEIELEKYWARKIITAQSPWEELRKFPYYSNYQELVKLESELLAQAGALGPASSVFVGSGSLPLTAILQNQNAATTFVLIDRDEEACELSHQMIRRLGLSNSFSIQNCTIDSYNLYDDAEVVYVAAMVEGCDLPATFRSLSTKMKPEQILCARSVRGMRCALYRPLFPVDLKDFSIEIEVHPDNDVVNSVIIARPYNFSRLHIN